MKLTLLSVIPLLLGCSGHDQAAVSSAQPTYRPASELGGIAKRHAYESRLSIAGIAWRDTTLYVATNIGLLEVQNARVTRIAQWLSDDNVVSGPWYDESRDRLWIKDDHDNILLYRGTSTWKRVELPKPPNGEYYTRGDMLEGFRGISDSATFRLLGAGAVWRWTGDSTWIAEERPPADPLNGIIGFGQLPHDALTIVSSGGCAYIPCTNDAYWRLAEGWRKPLRLPIRRVDDAVAASGGVFVRGHNGELLRIDRDSVVALRTPGRCEAIARSSTGKLLASFRGVGLFMLESTWRKLFDDPADPSTGEQLAFIVEYHGRVAFATTTVPQLKPGSSDKFYESGNLGLWVADGARLVRVALGP